MIIMVVAFIAWPLLGLILAIANVRLNYARWILIAFCGYYGLTMVFENETLDSFTHAERFIQDSDMSFSEYLNTLGEIFSLQSKDLDIYVITSSFIVSLFSSRPEVYYFLHAIVFGFFYISTLYTLLDERKNYTIKNELFFVLFVIALAGLVPISQVNSIRQWTAAWIFTYGVVNYIRNKPNYLFVAASSILVHFMFALPVSILFLYSALGRKNNLYWTMLAVAFILNNAVGVFLDSFGNLEQEGVTNKIKGYSNENWLEARETSRESVRWFVKYKDDLINYSLNLLIIRFITLKKKLNVDAIQERLYSLLILFASFTVLVWDVEALGNRMRISFWLLCFYFFARLYLLNNFKFKYNVVAALPLGAMVLWMLVDFRTASTWTSDITFFGNIFYLILYPDEKTALFDLIFK